MSCATRIPLCLEAGEHFALSFWAQTDTVALKAITAIAKAAPCALTVASHGLPASWPIAVDDSPTLAGSGYVASASDSNTLTVPVNSLGFVDYDGLAAIRYAVPMDLSGFTYRLRFLDAEDGTVVDTFTDVDHGSVDDTAKTVSIAVLTADDASEWAWYELQLLDGAEVYGFAEGPVSVA